jgi:hypothetical protein
MALVKELRIVLARSVKFQGFAQEKPCRRVVKFSRQTREIRPWNFAEEAVRGYTG